MFPSSVAVKKTALAALKNEWPNAIAAAVIPLAFSLVAINLLGLLKYIFADTLATTIVRIIFLFVLVFVGIPLSLGSLRILWGTANDERLKISELFYYFSAGKNYKRVFTFTVLLFGRIILKSVVLLLPSYLIDFISNSSSSLFAESAVPLWLSNIWIFALFLRIIAGCFIVYIASRYYLAPFLFIANDNADPMECINKSFMVSRVSVGSFVTLLLSLAGWIALSVFFVPMVFTLPYIIMCYLVHSRYAAVFYNSRYKKYVTGGGV